jgi:hypothetical protein
MAEIWGSVLTMMQHVTKAGSAADLAEAPTQPASCLIQRHLDQAYGHEHAGSAA